MNAPIPPRRRGEMEHSTGPSLRRDLSRRKPVPVYVPTPPASPYVPPASPARSSSSLNAPAQDVSPPLPDEWREVIELASSRNKSTIAFPGSHITGRVSTFPMLLSAPPSENVPSIPTAVSRKLSTGSTHTIHYVTRSASSRFPGNRKSHLNYRPPTPPTQARCKRQRVEDEDPPFLDSGLIPLHVIYPDMPLLHGAEAIRQMAAAQSIYANPEAGSLTTLNVDRTLHSEKAQSTHASTDISRSMTFLGSQSACNSTIALGDDVKRNPSWPDLPVPPHYVVGKSRPRLQSDGRDTGTQPEASFWERMRSSCCLSCW